MSMRTPQIRIENVRCDDLRFGQAVVKAAKQKNSEGWLLPGGVFTRNRIQAFKACKRIDYLIESLGGVNQAARG